MAKKPNLEVEDGDIKSFNDIKKVLEKVFIQIPFNYLSRRVGKTAAIIVFVFIGIFIILLLLGEKVISSGADWRTFTDKPKKEATLAPANPESSDQQEKPKNTPLQDIKGLRSFDNPCRGELFEVIQQLDDVWGKEKPFSADQDDPNIISASDSANNQVAKKYPFSCRPPWELTLSFTPLKEQSVGVFVEYEDVFKVLLGDGDRETWKLEKNDQGRKASWTEVVKAKLAKGKISLNKEVTIILSSKLIGSNLELRVRFRYFPEGKDDYIWEDRTVNINAKATDLIGVPARPFRVGLNDWRYHGSGSEIKFGVFSIKEIK